MVIIVWSQHGFTCLLNILMFKNQIVSLIPQPFNWPLQHVLDFQIENSTTL
jgi:hypothetical protein